MSSRIQELESSVSALEIDLKGVQTKEAEAKLAAEKVTEEINQLKDEVKGKRTMPHHYILSLSLSGWGCYCCDILVLCLVLCCLPFEINRNILC